MKIKSGQIVALTTGEYSDYNLRGHVKALCDFDTSVEIERFKLEGDYLDPKCKEYGSDDRFLAWAIRESLIEPMENDEVVEWYLGAYSKIGDY